MVVFCLILLDSFAFCILSIAPVLPFVAGPVTPVFSGAQQQQAMLLHIDKPRDDRMQQQLVSFVISAASQKQTEKLHPVGYINVQCELALSPQVLPYSYTPSCLFNFVSSDGDSSRVSGERCERAVLSYWLERVLSVALRYTIKQCLTHPLYHNFFFVFFFLRLRNGCLNGSRSLFSLYRLARCTAPSPRQYPLCPTVILLWHRKRERNQAQTFSEQGDQNHQQCEERRKKAKELNCAGTTTLGSLSSSSHCR